MAFLNFGTMLGLAQDLGGEQRIADMRYNEEAMKRSKSEAEAKAKLLAKDYEYNNALNEHDRLLITADAEAKIKEVGNYERTNPGWQYDHKKVAERSRILKSIAEGEHAVRGVASDQGLKEMRAYMSDPANANLIEVKGYREQFATQEENYKLYGNQAGEDAAKREGRKAFTFNPPEKFTDFSKYLHDISKSISMNGIKNFKGQGGYIQYAEHADLQMAAIAAINGNPEFKAITEREFAADKSGKYKTHEDYVISMLQPPVQKVNVGSSNTASTRDSSEKKNGKEDSNYNLFGRSISAMRQSNAPYHNFGPELNDAILSPDGTATLQNAIDENGKMVNLGNKKGIYTGNVRRVKPNANSNDDLFYAEFKVRQFVDDFEDSKKEGMFTSNPIIDRGSVFQPDFKDTSWTIHKAHKDKHAKHIDEETGLAYVETIVYNLINPDDETMVHNYNSLSKANKKFANSQGGYVAPVTRKDYQNVATQYGLELYDDGNGGLVFGKDGKFYDRNLVEIKQ